MLSWCLINLKMLGKEAKVCVMTIETLMNKRNSSKNDLKKSKRAVLSASMTLEASLIIPLFVFFIVIIIHVINLINFQNRMNEAMYNSARTLSKLEYTTNNSANPASAMALLYSELDKETVENAGVAGGILGITALQSKFDEDMICLTVDYYVRMPFDFLKIMGFPCRQTVSVRKWIGNEDKGDEADIDTGKDSRMVYIAETGTVYHIDRNCTHLRLSIRMVSREELVNLRNDSGGKYYPCELCGGAAKTVYITDFGDRYHSNVNCSGLKRAVYTIPIEMVEDRPVCSRCGG